VIGVGAVVLMMAVGQGAQYSIKQTIAAMGRQPVCAGSPGTPPAAERVPAAVARTR